MYVLTNNPASLLAHQTPLQTIRVSAFTGMILGAQAPLKKLPSFQSHPFDKTREEDPNEKSQRQKKNGKRVASRSTWALSSRPAFIKVCRIRMTTEGRARARAASAPALENSFKSFESEEALVAERQRGAERECDDVVGAIGDSGGAFRAAI